MPSAMARSSGDTESRRSAPTSACRRIVRNSSSVRAAGFWRILPELDRRGERGQGSSMDDGDLLHQVLAVAKMVLQQRLGLSYEGSDEHEERRTDRPVE